MGVSLPIAAIIGLLIALAALAPSIVLAIVILGAAID
jgi:hypothetical protein